MQRRVAQALLICIALAVALLVPVRAWAAILPACDNRELISLAPPAAPLHFADAPADPSASASCSAPLAEPEGDTKVAPMCDLRAASMIAPPRIHAIGDERIEAAPSSCELEDLSPAIGPSSKGSSAIHSSPALAEHAMLGASALVPRAASEPAPPYLPVRGEACAGVERDVYHPPR